MIYETYCSYEVARLLKEKGFPQDYDLYHSMVYNEEDYEDEYEVQRMVTQTRLIKAGTLSSYPAGVPGPKCFCPTHQMAMKWLREVHHIHTEICLYKTNKNDIESKKNRKAPYYTFGVWDSVTGNNIDKRLTNDFIGDTYEEAVEAALKYVLEKLI